MAIKIKSTDFSGAGQVYDGTLADAIRGLAQDVARNKVHQFGDITDSSGGTAAYGSGIVLHTGSGVAAFTETGTASTQKAAFDTAIGKTANAMAVLARRINILNGAVGLPLITDSTGGTVATEGTIPSQDFALSGVASSCLDVTTGRARLESIKNNMRRLVGAANRLAVAVGEAKISSVAGMKFLGPDSGELIVLEAIAASGTAVDGTASSTIAVSVINTELTKVANNIATLALFLNDITGVQATDLTDSTGGTATTGTIAALTAPAAAAGAATTSAPKAGFDTELVGPIENGLAELATRINYLLRKNGLSILTDSTGQSVNGTLEIIDDTLTAVDGSTGTDALEQASARVQMNLVRDAIASLTAKVNILAPLYGLHELTDSSGGTVSTTIANLSATSAGVGSASAVTMLDTDVDAWLDVVTDNFATLAAHLNLMTTSTNTGAQLTTDQGSKVVAWDA